MNPYGKMFMIGAALTIILSFPAAVLAQPFGLSSQQQQKSQHQILSSESGRFVFGQVSDSDKDKFMLDTFTGRLWRIGESGRMGIFLMPVLYQSAEGEYSAIPEADPDKGLKKKKTSKRE